MYSFDVKQNAEACIKWIKDWFDKNGAGCRAVVGISGGKDSSLVAALCARALGKGRVLGVLMPQGEQADINFSNEICEFLGIECVTVNIENTVKAAENEIRKSVSLTPQATQNLPPRIRMATLYAVSQSVNGRVANTCNLSEDWVGYSTRYGDSAGDFSPISHFTVTEVKQIGAYLGIPERFMAKPPADGLCGKTDEENLGFTYAELDKYIREGIEPSPDKKEKIDRRHAQNLFKLQLMPSFDPDIETI